MMAKGGHRPLPCLFVGSSVEGLNIANAVQENLDFDAEVTVWSQGIFAPNASTLASLVNTIGSVDFATFVFSPDDVVEMRSESRPVIRENVLFEYGLFCGALGLARCSFIVPRGSPDMKLPTDLLGIMGLDFNPGRSDQNLVAALGAASNQLRRQFRSEGPRDFDRDTRSEMETASSPGTQESEFERYKAIWSSEEMSKARAAVRSIPWDPRDPSFENPRESIDRVFAFLESLSDATLNDEIREADTQAEFGSAITSFWGFAATSLLPVGQVDPEDWWDPLPSMAILSSRWRYEKVR